VVVVQHLDPRHKTIIAEVLGRRAALEETAAMARHLATHTDLGEDAASQQSRTADWAGGLAESVRARVRESPEM
jgi:hypothetical protein